MKQATFAALFKRRDRGVLRVRPTSRNPLALRIFDVHR
jgi:hypothetical protein